MGKIFARKKYLQATISEQEEYSQFGSRFLMWMLYTVQLFRLKGTQLSDNGSHKHLEAHFHYDRVCNKEN